MTQGLTGGPRVAEPLYRSYGTKCRYKVIMVWVTHGVPCPVDLDTW
jgi:hypothetical protein